MSLIAISLNLILIGLLACALAYGVRLERKLKAIRDGQILFGKAAADLDASTERARAGLAELRATTDESTDLLGGRIVRAREAADRLERLVVRAEAIRRRAKGPEGGLSALLAELRTVEIAPQPERAARLFERAPAPPPPPAPVRAPPRMSLDDDLFEDVGGHA